MKRSSPSASPRKFAARFARFTEYAQPKSRILLKRKPKHCFARNFSLRQITQPPRRLLERINGIHGWPDFPPPVHLHQCRVRFFLVRGMRQNVAPPQPPDNENIRGGENPAIRECRLS